MLIGGSPVRWRGAGRSITAMGLCRKMQSPRHRQVARTPGLAYHPGTQTQFHPRKAPPMAADPNRVILTGENPFIRLSAANGGPVTTNASYWRIITCPAGPGHVLYLKSELTDNRWRVYSDNIAMARWLQSTVQGMLNPETADQSIPVMDAQFDRSGDPHYFWTERVMSRDEEIVLTWYDIG